MKVEVTETGPAHVVVRSAGSKRASESAGGYDAERGAKLVGSAEFARADAVMKAVLATGDRGKSALVAAFPALVRTAPVIAAEAVIVQALKKPRTMATLSRLCSMRGLAASTARLKRVRAQAMLDALAAHLADQPGSLELLLLKHFRALATSVDELDADAIVRAAFGDADTMARLEDVAQACGAELDGKTARKLRTLDRRVDAYGAAAVDAVQKKGAALPPEAQMVKRSWRVEVVDTPEGSVARPAYVVRIDANAPIGRLSRAARAGDAPALELRHVLAAQQVCALYFSSLKGARLVGSYDGVVVQGGGSGVHPIDMACAAWAKLESAMKELLPVEHTAVMEVCVYETSIEALAKRRGFVHFTDVARAKGAVVQTLRCGLERLAKRWGLDVGQPQDAPK